VKGLQGWQEHRSEGYLAVTVDVPTLWRPARKRWPRKHERPAANRALPAVIVGISGEGGELNGQREGLPRAFERVHSKDASAKGLWQRMRTNVQTGLQEDAMAVVDAGVNISALHEAGIERSRIRPATNFTARRNGLPDHRCGRKAKYGTLVRPLARRYNGTTLAATPPDETSAWEEDRRQLRAEIWRTLGVNGGAPDPQNRVFDGDAISDPAFKQPWLLATSVTLKPESVRAIDKDRWPAERIPWSARRMVGARRRFVHHPERVRRLPELALLAGSILSFLAATFPAPPTGFWDRPPQRTPGRFRRLLIGQPCPKDVKLPRRRREKKSVTGHLPKGTLARWLKMVKMAATEGMFTQQRAMISIEASPQYAGVEATRHHLRKPRAHPFPARAR